MSRAQCLDCLGFMESKHRHDFVKCDCGNAFLDGGDDYIRAGGNIVVIEGAQKLYPLRQDPELSELLEDVVIDDMFDDDYFDDYSVGYHDGVLDERERILKAIQEADSTCGPWAEAIILTGT